MPSRIGKVKGVEEFETGQPAPQTAYGGDLPAADLKKADAILLRLPFDVYGRYWVSKQVRALWARTEARSLRILDVGGSGSPLKYFLPDDEVVLVDPEWPPSTIHRPDIPVWHDGYVLGAGGRLPFADGSFDIVTAHDTLEHVPDSQRPAFLQDLLRVARRLVIVNGPVHHPMTGRAEERLAQFLQRTLSVDDRYLREHLAFGLPHRGLIGNVLTQDGPPHFAIPNGNLMLWLAMMVMKRYLLAAPHMDAVVEALDHTYNAAIGQQDLGGLCYREAYVIVKEEADVGRLRQVEAHFRPLLDTPLLRDPLVGLETLLPDIESLERTCARLRVEGEKREELLAARETALTESEAACARLQIEGEEREELLAIRETALAESEAACARLQIEGEKREELLAIREAALAERDIALQKARKGLESVQSSLGYRLLEGSRRRIRWLMPPGSHRAAPYRALAWGLRWLMDLRLLLLAAIASVRRGGPIHMVQRAMRVVRQEGWHMLWRKAWTKLLPRARNHAKNQYADAQWTTDMQPLVFPTVREPLASIIIPVFNKALYSYNCLKSVLENSDDIPYEVIVVDDASTDNTPEMLSQVSNINVDRKKQNSGFIETCHRGAELATGEYLVFLNNDTKVRQGWLTALLQNMEKDPSVGLVGAKLIYQNGRLQEAGGIIWSDGSGWNYGRLDDPENPEYNYVREVDYCSGACVAVRRDLWTRIGGFDRRYLPAYYEDTDLAFSIRALGYKVLYQPKAEVIHYEGITHGTELSSGIKRFQEINRKKFVKKWRGILTRDHLANGIDILVARDRRRGKMALIVDHHVPTHDRDSGSQRMFFILQILTQLGFAVAFLPGNLAKMEPYTEQLQQRGIEVLYGPMDLEEYLAKAGPHLDLVMVARPDVGRTYLPLLRKLATRAHFLYDTVDLHFLRESRRAIVEKSKSVQKKAEELKELELSLSWACDAAIVVSEVEKEILQKESPSLKVHVIPNIHEVYRIAKPFACRRDLLFVGHFVHPPNEDGMLYFVKEAFPLIKKTLPDLKLYIVGNNPTPAVKALATPDVIVTGWVKDLTPFFEDCRVFVAPLRYGAGVKGKIGQSLSYGLPVVTTSIGAEGMGLVEGRDALIADTTQHFARKVLQLYNDEALWTAISESSLAYIEKSCTPEVMKQRIADVLSQVIADAPQRAHR
jgi:GT2 family glycosyltransferase